MGFSIYVTVCIGAVIESTDEYDELEDSLPEGYELDLAGSTFEPECILILEGTKTSTYFEVAELDMLLDIAAKTRKLTNMLDSINISYTKAGLLLYPYFSH